MQYLGGKSRAAKHISEAIVSHLSRSDSPLSGRYFEPFVGGGSISAEMGYRFDEAHYSDMHPDLMLLWDLLLSSVDSFSALDVLPDYVSEDDYREFRSSSVSAVRGFVGFACSFGGRWFEGYARSRECNFAATGKRSLSKKIPGMSAKRVTYTSQGSYESLTGTLKSGDVVYCDPPYAKTQGYATGVFDHETFWETVTLWVQSGVHVFVSEYVAPEQWSSIWGREQTTTLSKDEYKKAVEHLFVYTPTNTPQLRSNHETCKPD